VARREKTRKVAIFSKPHPEAHAVLQRVAAVLRRRGIEMVVDEGTAAVLRTSEGLPRANAVEGASLVVSVGGDGTLLAAARAVGPREIPILGVNLGHLGFLTETPCEEIDIVLDGALSEQLPHETRSVLTVARDGELPSDHYVALNDVVFSKRDLARLFSLSLFVDGEWVTDYRADGLILSTPTGSTAYSLAAGGPVICPAVDALLATPICPHSLSQRPLILPGEAELSVALTEGKDGADVQVTVDGQLGFPLEPGEHISIARAAHRVKLIRAPGRSFFAVMRDKLGWGHP
jgi:NAD+ kinase